MQAYAHLNGSKTKNGNYVWGAALTLAWKNLCKQIIKEDIKVKSDNKIVKDIVYNFNSSPCDFAMLSQDCYYAKAGFGNKTVHIINQEVKKKFPQKTTQKVSANLQDDSIISFAYFFKKLLFHDPFTKKDIQFNNKTVPGFTAKTKQQKQQIRVNQYKDKDNFLIQLKTKSAKDHVFILKSSSDLSPEQAMEKITKTKSSQQTLQHDDAFQMPKVSLKQNRTVQQLIGVFIENKQFAQYFFGEVYEIINFDLDESGVKVQNEGVVKLLRSGIPMINRQFVLDKPFWVVMRETNKHPYFVAYINNVGNQ